MTVEELKNSLLGKEYPDTIQLGAHQKIVDVPKFLEVQFYEAENWTRKDITKCPAYYRLMQFYEATR